MCVDTEHETWIMGYHHYPEYMYVRPWKKIIQNHLLPPILSSTVSLFVSEQSMNSVTEQYTCTIALWCGFAFCISTCSEYLLGMHSYWQNDWVQVVLTIWSTHTAKLKLQWRNEDFHCSSYTFHKSSITKCFTWCKYNMQWERHMIDTQKETVP